MKRPTHLYVVQLPQEQQDYIKRALNRMLYRNGYKGREHKELLDNAMSEKVCNLSDAINLRKFYKKFY